MGGGDLLLSVGYEVGNCCESEFNVFTIKRKLRAVSYQSFPLIIDGP